MSGQPFLCDLAVRCEMDELGIVAGAVEDPATADGRPFDDRERQTCFQRKAAVDADGDDATSAVVGLMKRKISWQDDVAGGSFVLLADQPAAAVIALPCRQLPAMAFGWLRRAIRPGDEGADGCHKCDMR